MVSLRLSYVLLVLTSAILPLAFASNDPVNVMLAVASLVIAGAIFGQARDAANESRQREPRR
jgi:hypothetical protein